MMSTSLIINSLISVMITSVVFILCSRIYKKTTGGSKAYYFWALAAAFIFVGTIIGLVSSFFMDINAKELNGVEGLVAIIQYSLYLVGYYYIVLAAIYLSADLKITKTSLEKVLRSQKLAFLGVIIWSSFVALILLISKDELPLRLFYTPIYTFAWIYGFFALLPFYKTVQKYAGYWIYLLIASLCGFVGNLAESLSYIISDELIVILPVSYSIMFIFIILGFYKLGKDVEAF